MEFHLVPNQQGKCDYNPNLVLSPNKAILIYICLKYIYITYFYILGLEGVQEFSETGGGKMWEKCLHPLGFLEKSHIFLGNIGHSFETSGWIFFTKTIISF